MNWKPTSIAWYKIFRYPFNIYGIQNEWMSVKHAWQRAFRGYDDTAYWGLCSYITDIAFPVLKAYQKNKSGIPMLDGYEGNEFKDMEKEWKKILGKMVKSFELMYQYEHSTTNGKNWEKDNVVIQEGLALFAKYFGSLWD